MQNSLDDIIDSSDANSSKTKRPRGGHFNETYEGYMSTKKRNRGAAASSSTTALNTPAAAVSAGMISHWNIFATSTTTVHGHRWSAFTL
jgi:chorismate synthase